MCAQVSRRSRLYPRIGSERRADVADRSHRDRQSGHHTRPDGLRRPTILRASGTLGGGFQEFTAPVDSSVRSLQFTVFAECVKTIAVTAPSGALVEGEKLSSGRIVFVDGPQPGLWRVKLAGTGYFSAIAQGKTAIVLMTQSGSEFQGVFTPPTQPFRLAVEGTDTAGAAFRRVHTPLLDTKQP
jgi:hypothetical protein